MGKIIKVPLRINMMNLHSPTSSFSSIIPFSFNSCNLRAITIILFDLIQGNDVPHLLSKDFASCFANMTNEHQTTRKISRTIKTTIFLRFYILQLQNVLFLIWNRSNDSRKYTSLGWICNPAQLAFFTREVKVVLYVAFIHHR